MQTQVAKSSCFAVTAPSDSPREPLCPTQVGTREAVEQIIRKMLVRATSCPFSVLFSLGR